MLTVIALITPSEPLCPCIFWFCHKGSLNGMNVTESG